MADPSGINARNRAFWDRNRAFWDKVWGGHPYSSPYTPLSRTHAIEASTVIAWLAWCPESPTEEMVAELVNFLNGPKPYYVDPANPQRRWLRVPGKWTGRPSPSRNTVEIAKALITAAVCRAGNPPPDFNVHKGHAQKTLLRVLSHYEGRSVRLARLRSILRYDVGQRSD